MRLAAIADIHGNCLALEAVLADIEGQGVDRVVNLGDHLSGPLEARRTADLLMRQDFLTIRGNHDRWLVERDPAGMGASDSAAFAQLDDHHIDWLAALPPTATIDGTIFLCHGTPISDVTYWMEEVAPDGTVGMASLDRIEHHMEGIDCPVVLCGHTHTPRIVTLAGGRMIVNPGSVGCPGYDDDTPVPHVMQTGSTAASYAILDDASGAWTVTFRHVPYDNAAMARLAQQCGRPEWASALACGWVCRA